MNNRIKEIVTKYTNQQLVDITLVEAGLESEVAVAKLTNGPTIVVKYAKPGRHPNYILEADAYRRLKGLGAKVPEVLHVDEESLVMSKLPGAEMDDQEELYQDQVLFDAIAKDLALCWQVSYVGFGPIDMLEYRKSGVIKGSYPSWAEFLQQTRDSFGRLRSSGHLDSTSVTKLEKYWRSAIPILHLGTSHLIHGDFAMSAIFVDDGKYSGTIDFGDALIGDPLMDLAYFKFKEISKDYGELIYRNLSEAYRKHVDSELLENYEVRINLYMIYWGVLRVLDCPDEALKPKFAAKLKLVAKGL
jgi:aminoglycoside phosphotransferase